MKIIAKDKMKDGTKIQIEDWSNDYTCFSPSSSLAAYPISKNTVPGCFSPRVGETFRVEFQFNNAKQCKEAFDYLASDKKLLHDYKDNMYIPPSNVATKEDWYKCL